MPMSTIEAYTGPVCPHCSENAGIVEVHGHVQCAACHQPLVTCCEGVQSYDPGVNFDFRPHAPPRLVVQAA